MKVFGTGAARSSNLHRVKKSANGKAGDGFVSQLDNSAEDTSVAPASSVTQVTAVDGLLALQEVPDALDRKRQLVRRGNSLLDRLDEIRIGLLDGRIPHGTLTRLLQEVQNKRESVDDPGLLETLDAIELRARVELAKYS
jgi:hypothetical protein